MRLSPADREPRQARLASSPPPGGHWRGRDQGDAARAPVPGPEQPHPAPPHQGIPSKEKRRTGRPGSHTVHCPRAAAARGGHPNNFQSAAGDPTARGGPSSRRRARSSGAREPRSAREVGRLDSGPAGLSASGSDPAKCRRRLRLTPSSCPPSLAGRGAREVEPLPPPSRYGHGPGARRCPRGVARVPAATSSAASSAGTAQPGAHRSAWSARPWGASRPCEPLLPPRAPRQSPESAEPPRLPHSRMRTLPARAAARYQGPQDSPEHHQLPVFHWLLIGGAVLLLARGKHGAPLGRRRRRRLRRDPRRVRAAATIPSRERGERAGEGHGGEGGAGRPVPLLLRSGCAAAPPDSPELRAPRPPRVRAGNKWDRAVGGPACAERRRRSPAGGREGGGSGRTRGGGRAGEAGAGARAGGSRPAPRGASRPPPARGAPPPPARGAARAHSPPPSARRRLSPCVM